jgi:ribosome-associated protein
MSIDDSTILTVTPALAIPRTEIQYRATRAGGAGGQHVNTSSTRIELLWNLPQSVAVTDEQRDRIRIKLANRLDSDGMVRVVASDRRSQAQNKVLADNRLVALVQHALHVAKKRRATKPTRAAKEKRLESKKKQANKKRNRRSELD